MEACGTWQEVHSPSAAGLWGTLPAICLPTSSWQARQTSFCDEDSSAFWSEAWGVWHAVHEPALKASWTTFFFKSSWRSEWQAKQRSGSAVASSRGFPAAGGLWQFAQSVAGAWTTLRSRDFSSDECGVWQEVQASLSTLKPAWVGAFALPPGRWQPAHSSASGFESR